MTISDPSHHARHWTLAPGVAHLNHGSFGATPTRVQHARREWLGMIESSPERFFRDELHERLAAVRRTVAGFLGVDDASLALVGNVTEAVGIVLRTIPVRPGSNIVTSSDGYEWVTLAATLRARQASAEVRTVELPRAGPDFDPEVLRRYLDAIDDDTALVVIDQVTSPTALRLPVASLVRQLRGRVPVLVDGAHGPGVIPDPVTPDADFWVGSLHKWAYAPRGTSVLVAQDRWRDRVAPLVASDGTTGPFPANFDYTGTRDHSGFLAIPTALEFPATAFDRTWPALATMNVEALRAGVDLVQQRLGATPCGPVDLPMSTLEFPIDADAERAGAIGAALRSHGVEVAAFSRSGRLHVRLSAQPYVAPGDFGRFCDELDRLT